MTECHGQHCHVVDSINCHVIERCMHATLSCDCHVICLQVHLKVYTEEDARNSKLLNTDNNISLMTNKVPLREFGHYVQDLHTEANRGFREQFNVS